MLENLKQQFSEALPSWLQYTATGKKLLQERDEAMVKAKSVAEATAAAERQELVRQYQEALLAEANDGELQRMIQERDEFMAESQHPKTRQVYAECTLQLKRLNDAVLKRIRPHRERVDRLRKELLASAPAELDKFIEQLTELQEQTQRVDCGSFFDVDRVPGVLGDNGVLSYKTLRPSQVSRLEAILAAKSAVKKLKLTTLSAEELRREFAAILKTIPALAPTTMRRREGFSGQFVAAR